MTTYTIIADSEIDPESAGTTTLFTKLRDNPIAITEKAAGAPVLANDYIVTAMIGDGQVTPGKLEDSTTGSYQESPDDSVSSVGYASYTKILEHKVGRDGSITYHHTVTQDGAGGNNTYTKVYKNGSAYGSEHHTSGTTSPTNYSETVAVLSGDLVQIYMYTGAGGVDTSSVSSRVLVGNPIASGKLF